MTAYYNEIDEKAAAWLRELIARGLIADGVVDTRSIEDVIPADLAGFTQCHFFAGIGVWSHALRRAGWPDDRPVWTGSCPCQPFSAAGKGGGFDDERHLWPSWFWLIEQCRPDTIFGEQVSSKDGLNWFDLVSADLEGAGYAAGALDTCAAGVGAPHIRQRLYWVADAVRGRAEHGSDEGVGAQAAADRGDRSVSGERLRLGFEGATGGLAHADSERRRLGQPRSEDAADVAVAGEAERLADAEHAERRTEREVDGDAHRRDGLGRGSDLGAAHPTDGLWRDADWLLCRDGKFRPVEPGTFPLAHGAPARVGRLRGYGNGLVAAQAQEFIESWLETGAGS